MTQTTLGSTERALKSKVMRRAQFLAEVGAVVPWPRMLAVNEPPCRTKREPAPRGIT